MDTSDDRPSAPQDSASAPALQLDPPPLLHFERDYRWENKETNVEITAARLYDVWNRTADGREPPRDRWRAGLNALRAIASQAQADDRRVRAYGGTWSLSDDSSTRDYLIDTKPLNFLSLGLPPEQLLPSEAKKAESMVFAQGGIRLMELNLALEAAGLALPTSGASNRQTLAGAIATGTHGASVSVGSMQDFVRGIHLVTEGGRHVYLEPASQALVSDDFVALLGAEHVKSDALFHAALVSFGSFGLVHGYVFEAAPLYELSKYRFRVDHEKALSWFVLEFQQFALQARLPPAVPHHLEVIFDPYSAGAQQHGAYVTAMYPVPPQESPPMPPHSAFEPGDDVMNLVARLEAPSSGPIPTLVSDLASSLLTDASDERATPGNTFNNTNIHGPVQCAELGVSLAQAPAAVRAILEEAVRHQFPGLVAVRFVRSSLATLAFTKFEPTTCTIALPGAAGQATLDFYAAVRERLDREDIAFTQHWGQRGEFSRERVRRMYGSALDVWVEQRRRFLSPAGRRLFSNALLERCGLAD